MMGRRGGTMMMGRRSFLGGTPTPTPTPTATVDNTNASSTANASSISGFAALADPLDARLTALGA